MRRSPRGTQRVQYLMPSGRGVGSTPAPITAGATSPRTAVARVRGSDEPGAHGPSGDRKPTAGSSHSWSPYATASADRTDGLRVPRSDRPGHRDRPPDGRNTGRRRRRRRRTHASVPGLLSAADRGNRRRRRNCLPRGHRSSERGTWRLT